MPHPITFVKRRFLLAAGALALGVALAGCEHRQLDQMTQAVESGERPVALAGSAPFFGGKVVVRVTIARGIGHGYKRRAASFLKGPTAFDEKSERAEQDRANEEDAKAAYEEYGKAKTFGSPVPPVTMHLILINPGTAPVTVSVADFESELGNFVVYPSTLTIPPGDSAEPAAMVSLLGVSSSDVPFTVDLRLGKEREKKVIAVRNLLDENGKPKASQ